MQSTSQPMPPAPAAVAGDNAASGRRQWMVWRSPAGQPAWARPALLAVAALGGALYAWNLSDAGYAPYYAVAVKSMSLSWKAFFFGALDPAATVTIDKLAGAFAPQALSARVFGYHEWSLALPQVIEGVVAVLAMFRIVRRWISPAAGLVAASVFALTPIVASMFGHSMEDGALTMCLVLAADACQRAVTEGRPRSLLVAGVWVGLGFQAKMMQAWMILPALGLGYLAAAPFRPLRRLAHLSLAGLVTLAVSLSWIALYTIVPANSRPYVDGSVNNSAFAMVFGYNGFDRFGWHVPGAVPPFGIGAPNGPGGGAGGASSAFSAPGAPGGGATGVAKLITGDYGSEIGWLYPVALLSLAAGLLWWGRRDARVRGGFALWGVWLVTTFAVFSAIAIPHTAYLATLAPPLAALTGAGVTLFWRAHRDGRLPWLLPAVIGVEAAWTVRLRAAHADFRPWLTPVVVMAALLAITLLLAGRRGLPSRRRLLWAGAASGLVAMVATPSVWAASVLDANYAGSSFDAAAGPVSGFGPGSGPGFGPGGGSLASAGGGGFGGFPGFGNVTTLDSQQQALLDYLRANRHGARYLFATDSWSVASPYVMAAGERALPMGGFGGAAPQPTLEQLKRLVDAGQLRHILLTGLRGMIPGGPADGSATADIAAWARSACVTVAGGDQPNQATANLLPDSGAGGQTLLRCGR